MSFSFSILTFDGSLPRILVIFFQTSEAFMLIVSMLGKGLELLSANGGRFEINQLLFSDDTALVADSEERLGRLVSEFGRVCKEES